MVLDLFDQTIPFPCSLNKKNKIKLSYYHASISPIFSIKHVVMNYADHLWIVSDSGIFKQALDTFFISFEENYTILLKAVTFFCFTMLMSNNRRASATDQQLLETHSGFHKLCFPRIKESCKIMHRQILVLYNIKQIQW